MVYRVIGLMSGSSLDGLDIAYVELEETSGSWNYKILSANCYPYDDEWKQQLKSAVGLDALSYQLLHAAYGHYTGKMVNKFIKENDLEMKVHLVSSHGHTTFHVPAKNMTGQLGDGAAIAAETGLPVVSDLRAMDVALGGQGAPIVPIGEKLLLSEYDYLLNLGGIANLSMRSNDKYVAFDIGAANRVLNMLAEEKSVEYDDGGKIAAKGTVDVMLLEELNSLTYYGKPYPKSLANDFGTETVYPIVKAKALSTEDSLRTYVQHIVVQIRKAVDQLGKEAEVTSDKKKMLVTGGGAFNTFLIDTLREELNSLQIELVIPEVNVIKYKEALVMALIGVLRWREENNVLSSVTGASRDSVGGALWIGAH